ncbi:MAG: V4R domain-containing protein [Candidatus Bathyarchaeia archaeon]
MGEVWVESLGAQVRVISMTPGAFVEMMEVLNTAFGTASLTMFFLMGRERGIHDCEEGREVLRRRGTPYTKRHLLEEISVHSSLLGWGVPKIVKYDEGRGLVTIRVENNPIASSCKGPGAPICYFLRGYWVEVVSEVLEQEVVCEETNCISKENLCCEFVIKRGRRR